MLTRNKGIFRRSQLCIMHCALCIVAATLLTGCGLYNKYDRPDVVADGIVRDPVALNGALQQTDTTSFGNLPWRQLFTDPQLQSLI